MNITQRRLAWSSAETAARGMGRSFRSVVQAGIVGLHRHEEDQGDEVGDHPEDERQVGDGGGAPVTPLGADRGDRRIIRRRAGEGRHGLPCKMHDRGMSKT